MSERVLVIGATGRVGSELVKLLIQGGVTVRAATRNPSLASSQFPPKVEIIAFDYEKPDTFAPALVGIDKVFLTVRPGDNHSDRVAMPFIDEAKKAKVEHIVTVTAMGVDQDNAFMLRILEKYIETSGIPYTHLRPNWFMQNFSSGPMYADIRASGALHLPAADAKISFVDVGDIAAVGFATLTQPHHTGNAYTLTGQEALSHSEIVEKLSRVAAKTISYVPISEDIARSGLIRAGVPNDLIERWTDFYRKVRQGLCSPISTDIELVLGRPPVLFDQFADEKASLWR